MIDEKFTLNGNLTLNEPTLSGGLSEEIGNLSGDISIPSTFIDTELRDRVAVLEENDKENREKISLLEIKNDVLTSNMNKIIKRLEYLETHAIVDSV